MSGPFIAGSRLQLMGSFYIIELHHDGTGTIRQLPTNAPLCSVTSGNARLIESFQSNYVDRMAAEALKFAPVWGELRRPVLPVFYPVRGTG